MTSAITTLPGNKSVVVCNLALAPTGKPDATHANSNVKFQIAVEPMEYGSVANAMRIMCEDSCSNCFLPYIVNRVLEETTIGTVAVELVYGNGFKTYIRRKDGLEVKSFKQLAVNLSIGSPNAKNIEDMPILMPEDDLYFHVASYATATGMKPTLYIRTGGPLFLYPADKSNATSIQLQVPTKRGYWAGATFEGNRESYPKALPTKPTVTRKRKKPEEGDTKDSKDKPAAPKKAKKDDKDDKDDSDSGTEKEEDKPKKKAAPAPKKKPTPKKTKKEEDESEDSPSPSKKAKPAAKRGSVSKKAKEADEKKEEPAKKAAARRKSKSSTKK